MLIATAIGIPLGVIAAVRADVSPTRPRGLISLLGVSMPAFWLAVLMQLFFGLKLDWLPISGRLPTLTPPPPDVTGMYLVDSLLAGEWSTFREALQHIILPAIT